jgi:hypothetical protein
MSGYVGFCVTRAKSFSHFVHACTAASAFILAQLVVQVVGCFFGERVARRLNLFIAWGSACISDLRRKFAVWKLDDIKTENNRLAKENEELRQEAEKLRLASSNLAMATGQNGLLKELLQTGNQEGRSMAAQIASLDSSRNLLWKRVEGLEAQLKTATDTIKALGQERVEILERNKVLECSVAMLTQEGAETPFKAKCLKTFDAIAKVLPKLAEAPLDERAKPLLEAQEILKIQLEESLAFLDLHLPKILETTESRILASDLGWYLRSSQWLFEIPRLAIGGGL